MEASELWPGAHIRRAAGGFGVVDSVRAALYPQRMYNLIVEGAHTYFVGQGKWLVHNEPLEGRLAYVMGCDIELTLGSRSESVVLRRRMVY